MDHHTKIIMVRALRVHNYNNGTVGIEVPAIPLAEEDAKVLHKLFPNLEHRVFEVLDQESLLTCLHDGPLPESPHRDIIECGSPASAKVKPKFVEPTPKY